MRFSLPISCGLVLLAALAGCAQTSQAPAQAPTSAAQMSNVPAASPRSADQRLAERFLECYSYQVAITYLIKDKPATPEEIAQRAKNNELVAAGTYIALAGLLPEAEHGMYKERAKEAMMQKVEAESQAQGGIAFNAALKRVIDREVPPCIQFYRTDEAKAALERGQKVVQTKKAQKP